MKNNMLFVEFLRELKKSRNRFLSILLISFLGTAFFVGIRASGPDMYISADRYYDKTALFDIRLTSTLGFTGQEMEALKEIEGIEQVIPGYSADVYCKERNEQWLLHLMSLSSSMNKITLKDGRLPEKKDECVVDEKMLDDGTFHIGDMITFVSEEGNITDTLAAETFTIVGSGVSPYYLSSDRGNSSNGSGEVDYFVMLPEESFVLEAYTDLCVSVTGADEWLCYSEEYERCVDAVVERIEAQKDAFCEMRLESFVDQCEQKIADTEQKIADTREKLDGVRAELTEAEQRITDSWTEFEQKEAEFSKAEAALTKKEQEISAGWENYYNGITSYQNGLKEIEETEKNLPNQEAQLKEAKKQLEAELKNWEEEGSKKLRELKLKLAQTELQLTNPLLYATERAGYEKTKLNLKKSIESLEKHKDELQAKAEDINKTEEQLINSSTQLAEKKAQMEKSYSSLMNSYTKLEASESELHTAQAELEISRNELNDARLELTEKEEELEKNKTEFAEKETNAETEILEDQARIERTKKELEEATEPSISILDRESVETYVFYEQDADRIVAVGNVFPVIFFLIAVLICMMTMTRMVEENRTQIGTLKALGYTSHGIARKYLMYAFVATFIGGVTGMLFGQLLLPSFIIHAYDSLYNYLPPVVTPIHLSYSVTSVVTAVGCTLITVIAVCYHIASGAPAALMRPKAPKPGKTVFLEHINFIWKHLNFFQKTTFRNLFRCKKRLIMTVLGIGGCTGLLIAGFGLKDSIAAIGGLEYEKEYVYEGMLALNRITSVLIIAATVFAAAVLYNLNNINICERKHELADLKALGLGDMEVTLYVIRENIWLTMFGVLIGIGVGIMFHYFVLTTAEVDLSVSDWNISPSGFGWSICLVLLISALVNYAAHYKLTKIDIVESLKSTE